MRYTNYTTPQLQLRYATTTTTAALHHTQSSSCGWGDHCNHRNHSNKHKSNHLSVNQWIRSAIRDSQQPTSPIGFLFWNFRHRLVRYYWYSISMLVLPPFLALLWSFDLNPAGFGRECWTLPPDGNGHGLSMGQRHATTVDTCNGKLSNRPLFIHKRMAWSSWSILAVSINRGIQNGWFIIENSTQWMIWGYHPFQEIFILGPIFLLGGLFELPFSSFQQAHLWVFRQESNVAEWLRILLLLWRWDLSWLPWCMLANLLRNNMVNAQTWDVS